jgi:hypothetical protein
MILREPSRLFLCAGVLLRPDGASIEGSIPGNNCLQGSTGLIMDKRILHGTISPRVRETIPNNMSSTDPTTLPPGDNRANHTTTPVTPVTPDTLNVNTLYREHPSWMNPPRQRT